MTRTIYSLLAVLLCSGCSFPSSLSYEEPDHPANQKEIVCASFSENDEVLKYKTDLAIIEMRKIDLVELLHDLLEGDPPKADSIKHQLSRLEAGTNLEELEFPLLYYTRNAMVHLMEAGRCRVFVRKTGKHVDSIVVADWNENVAGGIAFFFKGSDTAFFKHIEWIT